MLKWIHFNSFSIWFSALCSMITFTIYLRKNYLVKEVFWLEYESFSQMISELMLFLLMLEHLVKWHSDFLSWCFKWLSIIINSNACNLIMIVFILFAHYCSMVSVFISCTSALVVDNVVLVENGLSITSFFLYILCYNTLQLMQ